MPDQNINRGTATTTQAELTLKKGVHGIYVKNRDASEPLRVRVPEVTGSEFDYVEPGDTGEYVNPNGQIKSLFVKTDANTADYSQGLLIANMPDDA